MTPSSPAIYLGSFGESLGDAYPIESLLDTPSQVVDRLLCDGHCYYRRTSRRPWELAADSALQSLLGVAGRPDLVVYCTSTLCGLENQVNGPAAFVDKLGLTTVQLIAVSMAGCANVGAGLSVAAAMLKSGAATTALLVTTDVGLPDMRIVRDGVGILSDGAASCILSTMPGSGDICLRGIGSDSNWKMYGSPPGFATTGRMLARGLRRAIDPVLRQDLVGPDRVSYVVTNNYTTSILELFTEAARIAPERLYAPTRAEIAHCHSADTLINLSRLPIRDLPTTSRVLLLSTGTHYWACALLAPAGRR